jgi:hypothetical protein
MSDPHIVGGHRGASACLLCFVLTIEVWTISEVWAISARIESILAA